MRRRRSIASGTSECEFESHCSLTNNISSMSEPPVRQLEEPANRQVVEEKGPWPFVTHRINQAAQDSSPIWSSRHHRKGLLVRSADEAEELAVTLSSCLWLPRRLNWWIGSVFAIGSMFFALASILSLAPTFASEWAMGPTQINAIFFAGSIPFTFAAYLQLFQAANASSTSDNRRSLFGWRPNNVGWLSCMLQFLGTILFNFNTFDAMIPSVTWFQQDLIIWAPNIVGSMLFLASGYLAFIETCHAHWAWKPKSISWWIVLINLLGCLGFMVSALFSISLPGPPHVEAASLSSVFTLQAAICFLVGSLLMLPETAVRSVRRLHVPLRRQA